MKGILIAMLASSLFAASVPLVQAQATTNFVTLDRETRTFLRTSLEDKWFKKENLASTLLGGALAIAGGFAATILAHTLQARRKRRTELEFSRNLLRLLRCELEALREIYDTGIGKLLNELPDGKLFMYRLALTEDWFSMFNTNAVHLGRIEGELSRQIIKVYALMKRLIEEYRINNGYIKEFDDATAESCFRPGDSQVAGKLKWIQELICAQTARIKEADRVLKTATDELFTSLDQRGIE